MILGYVILETYYMYTLVNICRGNRAIDEEGGLRHGDSSNQTVRS